MAKKTNRFDKIKKRDGRIVDFDQSKITNAIFKALTVNKKGGKKIAQKMSDQVVAFLSRRFRNGDAPQIEDIQDIVEEVLILNDYTETAKSYILYREQHRRIREAITSIDEAVDMVDKYVQEADWQIKENANMAYSLQGLNNYVTEAVAKKYWLNRIYPKEIREAVNSGDFHIHDLGSLSCYCQGWDLYDLLLRGFGGVHGKVESKPAKHLRVALGQLVNFFYTLQGEAAGAEAVSNFDTLLAPFIRYDGLNYEQVKQIMQEFLFNCAVPTRVGFQTPFINVTLDINPSTAFAKQPVIIGGQPQKENYADFQEEMNAFNKAFYECLMEGDRSGRPFTFPIPTVSITNDFDWQAPALDSMWKATAKYGVNYFSNFLQSEMDPDDVRSMCCRLRLDKKELYRRAGGLFGAGALTGSIGVVTINLPRIGYLSRTRKDYFDRLAGVMDLAKESLEIKRKILESFMDSGLYPYSRYYLEGTKKMRGECFGNHFSTIGLVGMNESLMNFMGLNIGSNRGKKFTLEVLDYMRNRLVGYQESTGNLYNLEATPAEGTSYRLALKDKEKYQNDIISAGSKEIPYYTNSTMLPVSYTNDLFEALEAQDEIQTKYTGGVVFHAFLGEIASDLGAVKELVKKVFNNFHLPYFTLTPTFSICPNHGYLPGEHFTCPKCLIKQPCEVYSRVVGYIRPIQQWHTGKQEEFKERRVFKISS